MGPPNAGDGFAAHFRVGAPWADSGLEEGVQDGCGPKAPANAHKYFKSHGPFGSSDGTSSVGTQMWSTSWRTGSGGDSLPSRSPRHQKFSPKFHGSATLARKTQHVVTGSGVVMTLRKCCRPIAESKTFIVFTTLLTVYVLLADDLRLRFFDAPADIIFSLITISCILIFSVEIFVSTFGKVDYFPGFFFFLDILATATLVLDIPLVGDQLLGDSDEGLDKAKGGRTARIAARASRMVRMLRLVRIVKLYKVAYEAHVMRPHHVDRSSYVLPGEDFEFAEEIHDHPGGGAHAEVQESALGRHLSDLTVRRVILLVIAMLIMLPILLVDEDMLLPRSASYGADEVWYSWLTSTEDEGSDATVSSALPQLCQELGLPEVNCPNDAGYSRYERNMLRYLYYHNWFARNEGADCDFSCPAAYTSQAFWVGMSGLNPETVRNYAERAQLRRSSVERWMDDVVQTESNRYHFHSMPEEVADILSSNWTVECTHSDNTMYGITLLGSSVADLVGGTVMCPTDLRLVERKRFIPGVLTSTEADNLHLEFWFDMRPQIHAAAEMSLVLTAVVISILGVSVMLLNQDVNELVVLPVENMISKVTAIRNNPLVAVKLAEDEFRAEERRKNQKEEAKSSRIQFEKEHKGYKNFVFLLKLLSCRSLVKSRNARKAPMETVLLEKTIVKLGSLLALGFGEAGANIIYQNMLSTGHETAAVNAMIPGSRVECIIGHCRIKNFSTATEALKERVITFVNQVAEIVHGVVTSFHGAPNKNHGETFLLIWRTSDRDSDMIRQLADMALMAMAKCVGAIHSSDVLAKYRSHPGLQQRLGSNYRVDLSCGLHYGWAIEGAVGSEFKIDASYLSPNVSCTVNVEKAAQIYGASVIATNALFELFSTGMQEKCRLVDRVRLGGSSEPLDLYCLDLATHHVAVEQRKFLGTWNVRKRFQVRRKMEGDKQVKLRRNVPWLFEDDPEVSTMRAPYTDEFRSVFNMGYQNYYCGQWDVARDMLLNTAVMLGFEDGPSVAILEFMANHAFEAPSNWDGVRDLMGPSEAPTSGSISGLLKGRRRRDGDRRQERRLASKDSKKSTVIMDLGD